MIFSPHVFCFAAPIAGGLLTLCLCWFARHRWLLQIPNSRSAHTRPTSLFGGIAIMTSISVLGLLAAVLAPTHTYAPTLTQLVIGGWALALGALGALDDKNHVSPIARACGQLLFAWGSMYTLHIIFPFSPYSTVNIAGGTILMLAFINAGNFSDGLNGLWSGTVLLWCLYVLWLFGPSFTLLLFAGCLCGFFVLNVTRGSIFLGDSGSTFLAGFTLLYGLYLTHYGIINVPLPIAHNTAPIEAHFAFGLTNKSVHTWSLLERLSITFAPFIFVFFDVCMTLLLRIKKGYSPLQPHKEHVNQHLVHVFGLSHAQVTFIYLAGSALGVVCIGLPLRAGPFCTHIFGITVYSIIQLTFWVGIYHRANEKLQQKAKM